MIAEVINWFAKHYIELFATITGFIYLWYSIREHILLWPFGLLSSALYVYVYFKAGIYADMGINVYYVVISIYGWIHWTTKNEATKTELPISRLKIMQGLLLLAITIAIYFLLVYVLTNYTNSTVAGWDAFTAALSITATWMLARKILEQWLIWVVADAVYVGLYIYKQLYFTVALYSAFTVLSVVGFYEWKKLWRKEQIQL